MGVARGTVAAVIPTAAATMGAQRMRTNIAAMAQTQPMLALAREVPACNPPRTPAALVICALLPCQGQAVVGCGYPATIPTAGPRRGPRLAP